MNAPDDPVRVLAVTRANAGRVVRWRGVRSGIRTYLQALVDGAWVQVVETRSDPDCLPPRALRRTSGEYAWSPGDRRPPTDDRAP